MPEARVRFLIEAVNNAKAGMTDAANDLERLKRANTDLASTISTQTRSYSLLNQQYKLQNYELYTAIGLARNFGNLGRDVQGMLNTWNIAQIRVTETTQSVTEAQAAYNQAVEIFGTDSVQALSALKDLETAQSNLKTAQEGTSAAMVAEGLSAIGLAGDLLETNNNLQIAIMKAGGLASALTGLAGFATGIVIPVTIAVAGLGSIFDYLTDPTKIQQGLDQAALAQSQAGGIAQGGGFTTADAYALMTRNVTINFNAPVVSEDLPEVVQQIIKDYWEAAKP